MQDVHHNRVWSWTDGSPVNYFHWMQGQPDNANCERDCCGVPYIGEYCVQIITDRDDNNFHYHWNDFSCELTMRSFVCKRAAFL